MEYRYLGKSGLQVSALSLGSWVTFSNQLNVKQCLECMQTAMDAGINFFDNAEAYAEGQSELLMGQAIKKAGWKRSEYVISTKIFWGGSKPNHRGLSRKHLIEGTDASLKRLGLDYVDLLFCHSRDPQTPKEEVVRAMNYLLNQGKALYWGTSNWTAAEILEACEVARREHLIPPTMEQPQYNLFHRERVEREFLPLYREWGIGLTTWSPLASGILTGKYNQGVSKGSRLSLKDYAWLKERLDSTDGQAMIAQVKQIEPIARDLKCTLAQLALAWCLKNPHVSTVITGASKPSQIHENLKALAVVPKLDESILKQLASITTNSPALNL